VREQLHAFSDAIYEKPLDPNSKRDTGSDSDNEIDESKRFQADSLQRMREWSPVRQKYLQESLFWIEKALTFTEMKYEAKVLLGERLLRPHLTREEIYREYFQRFAPFIFERYHMFTLTSLINTQSEDSDICEDNWLPDREREALDAVTNMVMDFMAIDLDEQDVSDQNSEIASLVKERVYIASQSLYEQDKRQVSETLVKIAGGIENRLKTVYAEQRQVEVKEPDEEDASRREATLMFVSKA
jgi:hypothetical protein